MSVADKLKKQRNRDKRSYRERNGTTRVGDTLRWMKREGVNIADDLLDLAGTVTGVEGLNILADKIRGDKNISDSDKSILLKELEYDMIEAQEVTKRWVADTKTGYWLPSNIRPMVLAFLTLSLVVLIVLDSSMDGFTVDKQWIALLSSILLLVYGGYFGARSAEKIFGTGNKLPWRKKKNDEN